MPEPLLLALYILLACLLAVLGRYAFQFRQDYVLYRRARRARVVGRVPRPLEEILANEWPGPPVDLAVFKPLWLGAAKCFRIDAELMKPSDRIEELIVHSEHFGHTGYDDIFFYLLGFLPHDDASAIAGQHDIHTVAELILAVMSRKGSA